LQDSPSGAFGHGVAAAGDCVRPAQGGPGDIASSGRGAPAATSVNSPARLAGTPDRKRFSGADNRGGVAAGRGTDCTRLVANDSGQAEKLADSTGNGDHSSSGSGSECDGAILSGTTLELASPTGKSPHIETPVEFFTASPPMGPLLIKSAGMMLF
jgi:hypothetical protein